MSKIKKRKKDINRVPLETYHIVSRILIDDSINEDEKIFDKKDYTELIFKNEKELITYISSAYGIELPKDFYFLEYPLENLKEIIEEDKKFKQALKQYLFNVYLIDIPDDIDPLDYVKATVEDKLANKIATDEKVQLIINKEKEYLDEWHQWKYHNNKHITKHIDLLDEAIATEPIKEHFRFLIQGWINHYTPLTYGDNIVEIDFDEQGDYKGFIIYYPGDNYKP